MLVMFITCSVMHFFKSVTYSTQSSDKEQIVISHVGYMFRWQAIGWITAGHDFVDRWLAGSQLVMALSTGDWLEHSWWWLCWQAIGWIAVGDDFVDRRLAEMWSGWVHKHCSSYSLIWDQYTLTLYIIIMFMCTIITVVELDYLFFLFCPEMACSWQDMEKKIWLLTH